MNPAICTLDIFQATMWLTTLGISVEEATRAACKDPQNFDTDVHLRADCSYRVSTAIASAFATSANIAGTFSACGATIDAQAECAGTVSLLGTSLGLIAAAGSDMLYCGKFWTKARAVVPTGQVATTFHPKWTRPTSMRKPAMDILSKRIPAPLVQWAKNSEENVQSEQLYQRGIVKCVIETNQAAAFIARAALQLQAAAAKLCVPAFISKKGQEKCTVDILSLITSFSSVVAFLSLAAVDCAGATVVSTQDEVYAAKCSGDIATLVAAVSLAAAVAVDFPTECSQAKSGIRHTQLGGGGRRLAPKPGGLRAAWLALLDRFQNGTGTEEGGKQLRAWVERYREGEGDGWEGEEEEALFGGPTQSLRSLPA